MAIPRNQAEIQALDSFQPLVEDLNFKDGVFMRFLRARDLDLSKTEDMIRKFVEWRITAKCNQYLGWTVPLDLFEFDMYLTGFDTEGRPVFWAPYGFWPSVRDLLDRGMVDDILKYAGKMMEKVYQLLLLTKHQQFIALVDSDGVTFSKVLYEARNWRGFTTLMSLLYDYEKNFPELLHQAYMINTPLAFMWGWKFLSPCFDAYTLSKVHFYGAGNDARKQWETVLFDNIPECAIPSKYGGHATPININQDLVEKWEEFCLKNQQVPESNMSSIEQ